MTLLRLPRSGAAPLDSAPEEIFDLFRPLEPQRSSDRIAGAIRETIFLGKLRAGDVLPAERALAERFQVTRNTVREALRHLEQLRLVSIRQGSGVTVRDYLSSAGIELLSSLLEPVHGGSAELLADVLEARALIGEVITHSAIDRLDLDGLGPFVESVEAFVGESQLPKPDVARLQALDYEAQNQLVRAGGNRAFVLLHNSLRHVLAQMGHLFEILVSNPKALAHHYQATRTALLAGDRGAAKAAMSAIFALGRPPPSHAPKSKARRRRSRP